MRSIQFPRMFSSGSTNILKPSELEKITLQNIRNTLLSERGELTCDPYFGLKLRHFTFEPNNHILKEQLSDMIYTQLALFIPQIHVERKDIEVFQPRSEKGKVYCKIKYTYQTDFSVDSVQLLLFNNEPEN